MEFSAAEKSALFSIARSAISEYLMGRRYALPEVPPKFGVKAGVFVTLREKRSQDLRGCIGYPLPSESIAQAVLENAINSAFHDPRFPPLRRAELESISIEITILTPPKEVHYKDQQELISKIEIGRDGLIAEYGNSAGLFLPQVPVEEGWDKKQYLSHLCMKAGLEPDAWLKKPLRIKSFQGIVLEE